jgi:hypothetical protein
MWINLEWEIFVDRNIEVVRRRDESRFLRWLFRCKFSKKFCQGVIAPWFCLI